MNILSRKKRFARKSFEEKMRMNKFIYPTCIALWLALTLKAFSISTISGVLIGTMFSPLVGWRICTHNVTTIFIFYFGSFPAAFACWLLLGFSYLYTEYSVQVTNLILYLTMLSAIPLFTLFLVFMKRRGLEFLGRAKRSLELLNAVSLTATGLSTLFTYTNLDFSFMDPVVDFESLSKKGFQTRDAFNYLSLLLSFPFVVSGAFCKFLVETFLEHPISQRKLSV